jgi:hypothetical protein
VTEVREAVGPGAGQEQEDAQEGPWQAHSGPARSKEPPGPPDGVWEAGKRLVGVATGKRRGERECFEAGCYLLLDYSPTTHFTPNYCHSLLVFAMVCYDLQMSPVVGKV